jgi:hypothetical protein
MPETIDKALNMAIIATNDEREEKALVQENRGMSTKIFAVGGNRKNTVNNRYGNSSNKYEKPRSGKFQ